MKTKPRRLLSTALLLLFALAALGADSTEKLPDSRFAVNVSNGDVRSVLQLIATKAGLNLNMDMEHDSGALVTINKSDISVREILDQISRDQQLDYSIEGNDLVITKRSLGRLALGRAHLIPLHYANAAELMIKLRLVTAPDERLFADERSNNLVFMGSLQSFAKIQELVAFFDTPLKQVMIEAQIIETSDQFMRQLGVSLAAVKSKMSVTTSPELPSVPTFTSLLSAAGLNATLSAAESKGEAKIISRPKVVTLNNRSAKIESGTSFSVRTLVSPVATTGTSVSTGSIGSTTSGLSPNTGAVPGTLTSGLTTITAALTLTILPTIMDNGMVKLTVDINDSQPDNSISVDGIPGVSNNLANTSVVVKNGQTVVIAGLVKQSTSKTRSGVPILSDIPLLGALFRSDSTSTTNNELVVFITPTIDETPIALSPPPPTAAPTTTASAAGVSPVTTPGAAPATTQDAAPAVAAPVTAPPAAPATTVQ